MLNYLDKYAELLVGYSLEIQAGDRLLISTTTLAEPLVRELYKLALKKGAIVDVEMAFEGQSRMLYEYGSKEQLKHAPLLYKRAAEEYETYLYIKAPFNIYDNGRASGESAKVRSEAMSEIHRTYMRRTGSRELRRSFCLYPTHASAQNAQMNMDEYSEFVSKACKLDAPDPKQAWLDVRDKQQHIVDKLNSCTSVRYVTEDTDISFSTQGRVWINSDGQTNMPSGEVYTSPVEDSVNGNIYFSFPSVYAGHEVRDVRLWVKDGYIEKWTASQGQDFLDHIFKKPGTRRFGEAAIGTNYGITQMTNNILFDEKMGGTIHMAVGQSYLQAGGKNESSVHWDMITEMRNGGMVFADEEKIYENGKFIDSALKISK